MPVGIIIIIIIISVSAKNLLLQFGICGYALNVSDIFQRFTSSPYLLNVSLLKYFITHLEVGL
jgi:hypothetical protein